MANYHFNPTPLTQGGEKVVHVGHCIETGIPVVVKFLRQPYSHQDVERFTQEISRLQAAQGAGVSRLVDYNIQWVPPFFVEEYFHDGTLAKHMELQFRTGYAFDDVQALGYVGQILKTLAALHARNLIHRDVKPHNILMRNGELVFTDMGLGRTLNRPTVLQTRAFLGTPYYAAPEQELGFTGQTGVDHRSDLYAVGVILHELLTGQRGSYSQQTYAGKPGIRAMIRRLLMFDKNQRYATAQDALRLVQQLRRAA